MMNDSKSPLQRRPYGVTLIELIVVIAIAAIVIGMALPNFRSFVISARLSSDANGLIADMRRARSEAASRGVKVVMCPSSDGGVSCATSSSAWKVGRMVFIDTDGSEDRQTTEAVVTKSSVLGGTTTLTTTGFTGVPLTFSPYGGLFEGGSPAVGGSFKLCNSSSTKGRLVTVAANGKPSASQVTCP
jgi:type IV fimbrial biogenesis protein FimT